MLHHHVQDQVVVMVGQGRVGTYCILATAHTSGLALRKPAAIAETSATV
jgi:hypothetical protein